MCSLRDRAAALLESLEASQILLVEWETSLQIRLGYPLASNGVSQYIWPSKCQHTFG
jgi:hypothetical protein